MSKIRLKIYHLACWVSLVMMIQILTINNAESGWTLQVQNNPFGFSCIFFVDSVHGWADGYIKTTNGGLSWFNVNSGHMFNSTYFINALTGWGVAGGVQVWKTTDGAVSWVTEATGTSSSIKSITFLDSLNGWACAYGGPILHTSNGGLNWIAQTNGTNHDFLSISFANSQCGAACSQDAIICATMNGGNNWSIVENDSNYLYLYSASSIFMLRTPDSGNPHGWCPVRYAEGNYGDMLLTNSGCLAWGYIGLTNGIFSIYFTSSNCGWIGGVANAIYHTTDGCANWYNQTTPSGNGNLSGIFFSDSLHGWACSTQGQILHTTDGGGAPLGVQQYGNNIPNNFRLYQNYPNPFNPKTKIKFDVPQTPLSFGVRLYVYDLTGRKVATLVNQQMKPGTYDIEWDASDYASGVYLYTLTANELTLIKKMVLMK